MASVQEKAQVVLWFAETKSVTKAQRMFRLQYKKAAPHRNTILQWMNAFRETGSVQKLHGGGRRVTEEQLEQVRESFTRSPRKSLRRGARELQIPCSTLQRILRKRLRLYAYKVQLLHEIKANDKPLRFKFATKMLDHIDDDPRFLSRGSSSRMKRYFTSLEK
jgi:transposase